MNFLNDREKPWSNDTIHVFLKNNPENCNLIWNESDKNYMYDIGVNLVIWRGTSTCKKKI